MDELHEIRKRKKEQLLRLLEGGKTMSDTWPNILISVTDATFDDTVKKYSLVVVDCWAPWCGPCRMIGPVIEDLAKEMKGKIAFGKLNVDENQAISMKYKIMSIPTLLVFKNGNLVDRIVGAMPKDMLKQKLETYH